MFIISEILEEVFISSLSRVVSMVAPQIITLVICSLFQKYWRRVYQFCITGRIYASSSDHYLGKFLLILLLTLAKHLATFILVF